MPMHIKPRSTMRNLPACNMALWQGKSLLFDMDGVLLESRHDANAEGKRSVQHLGQNISEALARLKASGVKLAVTSSARKEYARRMLAEANLIRPFSFILTREDMAYSKNGETRVVPKDYTRALKMLCEASPLDNCAIIGDRPAYDVPLNPEGMVTAIYSMEIDFAKVLQHLEIVLEAGKGRFASGFDALSLGGGSGNGDVHIVRDKNWRLDKDTQGLARIIYFEEPSVPSHMQKMYVPSSR